MLRGVTPLLNEEAVRVINTMPRWNPGMQRGKAVAVKYTVPIPFEKSGRRNEGRDFDGSGRDAAISRRGS